MDLTKWKFLIKSQKTVFCTVPYPEITEIKGTKYSKKYISNKLQT